MPLGNSVDLSVAWNTQNNAVANDIPQIGILCPFHDVVGVNSSALNPTGLAGEIVAEKDGVAPLLIFQPRHRRVSFCSSSALPSGRQLALSVSGRTTPRAKSSPSGPNNARLFFHGFSTEETGNNYIFDASKSKSPRPLWGVVVPKLLPTEKIGGPVFGACLFAKPFAHHPKTIPQVLGPLTDLGLSFFGKWFVQVHTLGHKDSLTH